MLLTCCALDQRALDLIKSTNFSASGVQREAYINVKIYSCFTMTTRLEDQNSLRNCSEADWHGLLPICETMRSSQISMDPVLYRCGIRENLRLIHNTADS